MEISGSTYRELALAVVPEHEAGFFGPAWLPM
jgi:hypothetical protein